jgi:hypothetical protein
LSFGLQAAIGMSMASVMNRRSCTSVPPRQRCARDSGTSPTNSKKPMRVLTHCQAIVRLCVALGTLRWHWRLCGEVAEAEKLAAETARQFPNGTIWNAVQLPEIQAMIALNRGQPGESVELLASASPYERSYIEAVYLRGLAYLRMHKGAEAAAEFQRIAGHKGASWGATWVHPNWGQYYSLSYLGMARGFALAGDTAKARRACQDFFELWKDADSDVPVLKQAKAEYARLQ